MNASIEVNEFYDGSLLLRPFTEITGLAIDQVSDAMIRNVSNDNRGVLSVENGHRRRELEAGQRAVRACLRLLSIVANVQALT